MYKRLYPQVYCFLKYIIIFILSTHSFKIYANPQQPDTIPYFLKNQGKLYAKSPRKATLAWFNEARLGLFIHWGVWGKYHAAWAMFNQKIPFEDYNKTALSVDASGLNATEIVKLAEESGMRYITFVAKHHDGFSLSCP